MGKPLRDHARSIAGWVFLAWAFIKPILEGLEHLHLVATSIQEIRTSSGFMGFLTNPPSWAPMLVAVLGIGLIYWDMRRHRKSHSDRPIMENKPVTETSALRASVTQPSLRLEDVVKRLSGKSTLPGSNDRGSTQIFDVCEMLREKALQGAIDIFGGINWRSTRPADYDKMVRARVPADFWRTHRIDVIEFLGSPDKRGMTVALAPTARPLGAEQYYGIWFDKNQIDALLSQGQPEFVSLRDAATRLYDVTLTTPKAALLGTASEQMSGMKDGRMVPGSPNDVLDFMATHIARHIPIYGKKAPSTVFTEINSQDVRSAKFTDGAVTLRNTFYDKSIFWTDLAVRTRVFEEALEKISRLDLPQ